MTIIPDTLNSNDAYVAIARELEFMEKELVVLQADYIKEVIRITHKIAERKAWRKNIEDTWK